MATGLVRRAVKATRAVDQTIGRAWGRAMVLVEARTPMNLAVLQPVFTPLLHDRRIDVRFTGIERADLTAAFESAGLRGRVVSRASVRWMRIDLYVNADPWEAVKLRRVARRLNFFHGVAGKYDLDRPSALPLALTRYDRIAFPNESRLSAYVESGLITSAQAALVGFPKADALVNERLDPAEAARPLGLDPARPTVIFAPTFSPASALHVAGEAIVETLLDSGCNVVVKLHDRSLDPDPKYSGGVDWRQRFERFTSPRFLLADGADSTPYLMASNVMVSDHSSVAFEFCLLDRPLVLFDAPELPSAARINPEKIALLRSAALVARDATSLAAAVRSSLGAPAAHSAERLAVASQVFYRPGSATERAVRLVYELLGLNPAHGWSAAHSLRAWSLE